MDIKALKDKILQLAIQGKLVEQNPNDEPASVLLERIKEGKERLIGEGKVKREKPLPPITEDEIPYELPNSWMWVRINDIFSFIRNGLNIKQDGVRGGFPITRIETISEGIIDRNKMGYAGIEELSKYNDYILINGDILMSHINSEKHIGKTAIYEKLEDEVIIHGMNLLCFRSNSIVLYYKYAHYFFNSLHFNQSISDIIKRAVNQASINISNLRLKLIPLPPLAEQKRIAEKIDELFFIVDNLENNKNELLEVINSTRNKVLQEAVQGKLVPQDPNDESASVLLEKIAEQKERLIKEGKIKKEKALPPITGDEIPYELPKGWEWVRLGDVTNYGFNETVKPGNISEYEWVLELEDIEKDNSKVIQKAINRERQSKSNKNRFYKGDVLYGKLRPYLKKVLVAENDGVCSTEIIPFRGYCYIESSYIMNYMKSPYINTLVNKVTHGMNMPRLGTDKALRLLFPLPPFAEQKRIVEKVDQLMALCDELEKNIEKSKKDSELLVQSVLQEAFKSEE